MSTQDNSSIDFEKIVNNRESLLEWNNTTIRLPQKPLCSVTRKRKERVNKSLYGDIDFASAETEDLVVPLHDGTGNLPDLYTDFKEGEWGDEIFDILKSEMQSAYNPANTLFGRFEFRKKAHNADLSTEDRINLAKTADQAGVNIYVDAPLTAQSDSLSAGAIEAYFDDLEKMAEETGEDMGIVPTIDPIVAAPDQILEFVQKVNELPVEKFPLVALRGAQIFTNLGLFLTVRDYCDRPTVIRNCPKTLRGNKRDEHGPLAVDELYALKGASVILQKYFHPGPIEGEPQFLLLDGSDGIYESESIESAESSIPEKIRIQDRSNYFSENKSSIIDLNNLHNELVSQKHFERIRTTLRDPSQIQVEKPRIAQGLIDLSS